MNEDDKKRTNIEDLPRSEEELCGDEAKKVQGGVGKNTPRGTTVSDGGTLQVGNTSGNSGRIGGIAVDPSDPSGNT